MLRHLCFIVLVGLFLPIRVQADQFLYTLTLTDTSGAPLNLTTTLNSVVLNFYTSPSNGVAMATTSFASVGVRQGQAKLPVNVSNLNTQSYPYTEVVVNGIPLSPRRHLPSVPLAARSNYAMTAGSANDAMSLNGVAASTVLTVLNAPSGTHYTDEQARAAVLSGGNQLGTTLALQISTPASSPLTPRIQVQNPSSLDRFIVDSEGQTWLTTLNVWQEATMPTVHVTGMVLADESLKVGPQMLYAHSTSGVGINTIMPAATLHVMGHSGSTTPFAVMAAGASTATLHVSTGSRVGIHHEDPFADLTVHGSGSVWPMAVLTRGAQMPSLAVSSTGYVGVLTAEPMDALDVRGYVRAKGFKDEYGNALMAPNMAMVNGTGASVAGGVQNTASSEYAFVGGGHKNQAGGSASTVSGGHSNWTSGYHAVVGGGAMNMAWSTGTVSGGERNQAWDHGSVSGGGWNTATGYSHVGAGRMNIASGMYSGVLGGHGNQAHGHYGSVGGGMWNTDTMASHYNVISGGHSNWTSGWHAVVGGGAMNMAWSTGTVSGGERNQAWDHGSVSGGGWNTAANWSSVLGGRENRAEGLYSSVLGGHKLMISGDHSLGFNGYTSMAYTISQSSVAAFLGVSMGIGTTHPLAKLDVMGGIRIGEAMNPVTGTIAWMGSQFMGYNGSGWVSLQTQQSSGGGWTTGASVVSLAETSKHVAIGTPSANARLTVQGSISRDTSNAMLGPESMTFVNLGMWSQAGNMGQTATHVTIAGGAHHTASATGASVSGGVYNTAAAEYASITGGYGNQAHGHYGSVGGGMWNTDTMASHYNVISGGHSNWTSGWHAVVGGGAMNMAWSTGTVSGGERNQAWDYGSVSGGGWNTATGYSHVGAGRMNIASGMYSGVLGGYGNQAHGHYGSVGGGMWNTDTMASHYNVISGGHSNWTSGWHAVVGGGAMNMAWSTGTVSGGERNQAWDYGSVSGGGWNTATNWSSVLGGRENRAEGMYSSVLGGHKLRISGDHSLGFNAHPSTAFTISESSVASLMAVSMGINTTAPFADLTVVGKDQSTWSVAVMTAPTAMVPALAVENETGNIGIHNPDPQATLDVQGFARLKMYSNPPMTCATDLAGSIAMTSMAQTCVCTGGAADWVWSVNPTQECTWGGINQ